MVNKAAVVIGGLSLVGIAFLLSKTGKAAQAINLTAGWNQVVYTGKAQTAREAFASIIDYLEVAYYLDLNVNYWRIVDLDYIMVPGEIYYIGVTEDCIWTF